MKLPELVSLIRNARQKRAWSQQELADRAGIALGTLYRLEAGKSTPPVDIVLALLDALGLRIRVEEVDVAAVNSPWTNDMARLEERILLHLERIVGKERFASLRSPAKRSAAVPPNGHNRSVRVRRGRYTTTTG